MPDLLKENASEQKQKVDPSIYQLPGKKKKHSLLLWSSLTLVVVVLLVALGFVTKLVLAVNSTNTTSGEKVGFFEQIKHLIANPDAQISGEANDRINILLIGIGGEGHQGAYLADTIILLSVKPSTREVATISIPRDLYVEIPGYGSRKINNAMAFGHADNYPGGGEALLGKVVEQTTGQTINYYARIDFSGFRQAVDNLGGVNINVQRAFTDYEYPDYKFGYQTISFTKGWQHMSGEKALQYVRSRHGNNGEGSDFARSARQQQVLLALKNKFLSLNTLINASSIVSAVDALGQHNQTDLQIWEMSRLGKLVQDVTSDKLISLVLDSDTNSPLKSSYTEDGAYILLPRTGNFTEVQYLVKNVFNTSYISREKAKIEIQNGTGISGLGAKVADRLKTLQYDVVEVSNTQKDEIRQETTIYDLSGGTKPYTIGSLKNILNASVTASAPTITLPLNTTNSQANSDTAPAVTSINPDADILIILGQDQASTAQLTGSRKAMY